MTPGLRTLAAELTQDLGYARLIRLRRRSLILPQEVRILRRGPSGSFSDEAVHDRSVGQRHQPRDGPASIGDLHRLACLDAPNHGAGIDPELADSNPLHGRLDLVYLIRVSGQACASECVSVDLPLVQTYRARGWNALGDPTRRAIFELLADRPRAVGELASELPVSRPAVSQHLKVLKEAGLVVDRAVGNRRIYQLDPTGVGALRAQLDEFWNKALAAYKRAVEHQTEEVS